MLAALGNTLHELSISHKLERVKLCYGLNGEQPRTSHFRGGPEPHSLVQHCRRRQRFMLSAAHQVPPCSHERVAGFISRRSQHSCGATLQLTAQS
jgi:hypothetical protein